MAAVDPGHAGVDVGELIGTTGTGVPVADGLEALTGAGAEVVVDFTQLEVSRATIDCCVGAGIHFVVGTTGFTESDLADLSRRLDTASGTPAHGVVAANFAIGAVLMMRFAALAAPWFDGAEIIELHHEGKRDSPSGTSLRTAEGMAASRARGRKGGLPARRHQRRGGRRRTGRRRPRRGAIHSVRLPGLVAHQEVLLGGPGQGLTIRHDSYDRASFMDGVVLAVESVASRPGLTVGIESLLGI